MSAPRKPGVRPYAVPCFVVMAAVAALILWLSGLSPLTVILAAIAIGCLGAMFYAWRVGQRALKPLDRAGRTGTGRAP